MRCTLKRYRLSRAAIILLWLVGLPRIALPQNFPHIAPACATPSEALVGQLIAFSSAGSLDPAAGPEPLSFLWEFGDGATSTEANPVHAFAAPGAYQVSLTVSDGADTTLASVTVQVLAAPTERPPAKSSLLALAPDESQLCVVNPDSDSVSVLDVTTSHPSKQAEIPVGKSPRKLAFSPDGGSVFVPCQQRNELWVLDGKMQTVA